MSDMNVVKLDLVEIESQAFEPIPLDRIECADATLLPGTNIHLEVKGEKSRMLFLALIADDPEKCLEVCFEGRLSFCRRLTQRYEMDLTALALMHQHELLFLVQAALREEVYVVFGRKGATGDDSDIMVVTISFGDDTIYDDSVEVVAEELAPFMTLLDPFEAWGVMKDVNPELLRHWIKHDDGEVALEGDITDGPPVSCLPDP